MKKTNETFSTAECSVICPRAFKDLPKAYQDDDVLEFWHDEKGILFCRPMKSQEFAIGKWVIKYENGKWDEA